MGSKYCISFMRNGTCQYQFERRTDHLIIALWHLLVLSLKYPIVDFEIRRGYLKCEKCDADWCNKSQAFKAREENRL